MEDWKLEGGKDEKSISLFPLLLLQQIDEEERLTCYL
jgi:hypothetical protein